jgi:hypothetical protein
LSVLLFTTWRRLHSQGRATDAGFVQWHSFIDQLGLPKTATEFIKRMRAAIPVLIADGLA